LEAAMRLVAMSVVLLVTSAQAYAACSDDLQQLKPRIDRIKFSDKERYALANKWFGAAEKVEPYDELQCHNYYIRASRALTQPLEQGKNSAAAPGGGAGSSRPPMGPVTEAPKAPPKFAPPKPFFAPPGQP
jgi:hypothetical protein